MSGHPTWTQDNVVSLAVIGKQAGQAIVNVLHFQQVSGTQDPAGAATFADALNTDFNTNVKASWLAAHTADYTLETLRATPVAVSGLAHVALASHELSTASAPGTFSANGGNLDDAALIKLRTLEGGKSHRGRLYFGPIPQSGASNGTITLAGYITALTNVRTALARYIGAGAFTADGILVVFSRPIHAGEQQWTVRVGGTLTVKSNPAARVGDATPVTALVQDLTVRTQRRREVGVGA